MDDQTGALLAGTLALMTHYADSRCPAAAERIRENLLRLSALRHLPWEFTGGANHDGGANRPPPLNKLTFQ